MKRALSRSGFFFFVKNKSFYKKWAASRPWSKGELEILHDVFGEPLGFAGSPAITCTSFLTTNDMYRWVGRLCQQLGRQ